MVSKKNKKGTRGTRLATFSLEALFHNMITPALGATILYIHLKENKLKCSHLYDIYLFK